MFITLRHSHKNFGFTLVELMVSTVISVLLLGGVMFFISESVTDFAEVSQNTNIGYELHDFISSISGGDFSILLNGEPRGSISGTGGYDIGVFEDTGILFGIVDNTTNKLVKEDLFLKYGEYNLAYKKLESGSIIDIRNNPYTVFDIEFFPDKILEDFIVRDFQLTNYNSGNLLEASIQIEGEYFESLKGSDWKNYTSENIQKFSLIF